MVDSIFKKMGSVIAASVATEASARQAGNTTLSNNLAAETSARQSADTTLTNNLAAETSARQSADTTLTNTISALDAAYKVAVNTEKARIDAILSASSADKDSFAEIVTLINSVDTTNDNAFAGYVLSNDAAVSGKLGKTEKAADATLFDGVSSSGYIRYYQQANAPVSATDGSIWKDTDTGLLYMATNDSNVLTWFGI
jgi:hypothetical protein